MRGTRCVGAIGSFILIWAACSQVLEPEDIVGLWELESVNGFSVPGEVTVRTHDNIPRTIQVNYFRIRMVLISYEDDPLAEYPNEWLYRKR